MSDIVYPDKSYEIMGACFKVYSDKGNGFLESVYQECLEIELQYQNIPFKSQKRFPLFYRGKQLKNKYKADFTCFDKIILEIKAIDELHEKHESQILNYLSASDMKLGILINFGAHPELEYKRLVK